MIWILAVAKILSILALYSGLVLALERRAKATGSGISETPRYHSEAPRARRGGRVA